MDGRGLEDGSLGDNGPLVRSLAEREKLIPSSPQGWAAVLTG